MKNTRMDACHRTLGVLLATAAACCGEEPDAIRLPAWVEPAETPRVRQAGHAAAPSPENAPQGGPIDVGPLLAPPIAAAPEPDAPPTPREPRRLSDTSIHAVRQLEHAASAAKSKHQLTRLLRRYAATRERLVAEGEQGLVRRADRVASWAYDARGRHQASGGKPEAALADFEAALTANDDNQSARQNLAVSLAEVGRLDEAIRELTRVIAVTPNSAEALRNRASLRLQAGHDAAAIEDCDALLQLVETDPNRRSDALRLRGVAAHATGRLREAATDLNEAIRLDPHEATAYIARGHVFAEGGFYEQAITDYRAALTIDPASASAYRSLAWVLATCPEPSLRWPKTAVEAASRARKLTRREDFLLLDASAAAHAAAGDYAVAVGYQERAIEMADETNRSGAVERLQLYLTSRPYVAR